MAAKTQSGYSLKLNGPGVSFDRPISEEVANRIINLVMTGGTNPGALGAPGGAQPSSLGPPQGQFAQPQPPAAGMTIKQFIAQKRPENLYQRVACLGYYLSHVLDTPRFKTKDISKANTDAAASKFSNAAASVNDATTKYGYLSAGGGGTKQISAFGEQVVEALPDHEKVKQLHADNKSVGRKKAARKKKA